MIKHRQVQVALYVAVLVKVSRRLRNCFANDES
jgi:hypothetical protein